MRATFYTEYMKGRNPTEVNNSKGILRRETVGWI